MDLSRDQRTQRSWRRPARRGTTQKGSEQSKARTGMPRTDTRSAYRPKDTMCAYLNIIYTVFKVDQYYFFRMFKWSKTIKIHSKH